MQTSLYRGWFAAAKWGFTLAGVLALALLAFPAPSYAAPAAQEWGPPTLERLQRAIDHQERAVGRGDEVIATSEAWIADLQAQGVDTTLLEAALSEFRAGLDEARGLNASAAQILATRAGFDENGNVTDRQVARQTITDVSRSVREAHKALRWSLRDYRAAVAQFRRSIAGGQGQ